MTELSDGQRCPSREHVFSLLGFAPSSTVLAESRRDGLYLALVESPDGSQADGILLEFVDGQWIRLDEHTSRYVARAVGCDLSRAGSTIRIVLNEAVFHEAVSCGGWWAFVARVNDYHLLGNAILLPGPAEPHALPQPALSQSAVPEAALPQPALPQPALSQAAVPETVLTATAMAQSALPQPVAHHSELLEPADSCPAIDLSDGVESPPVVHLLTATEQELKGLS